MKILAIMGSPRKKGNTYQAIEGVRSNLAREDESLSFEYLFVSDYSLELCKGCFTCFSKGEGMCPLKDDLQTIRVKMQEADGIILAAPTYALGVPAIMKNFIDRMAYNSHRPCYFDTVFLVVTTTGGVMGMKQALNQMALLAGGGRLAKMLGLSWPPIPMNGFEERTQKSIQKASKAFYKALCHKNRRFPGIGDWFYFHSFKAFTEKKAYQDVCPADYAYYRDKPEYFYPLSGHPIKRLFGKAIRGIMGLSLGMMVKKQNS